MLSMKLITSNIKQTIVAKESLVPLLLLCQKYFLSLIYYERLVNIHSVSQMKQNIFFSDL